jgi:hypothetical protein
MKSFILSILFLFLFQTSSFAQKYEYDITGEHFSDTLKVKTITRVLNREPKEQKAIFEAPTDTIYIYHLVGEGENAEYILNLYQLCAPCLAKWNNLDYSDFDSFINQSLHIGEYLKVVIKKEYDKGMTEKFETRTLYQNFLEQTYTYDIVRQYRITEADLRLWNNLDQYAYYVEDIRLVVGEIEYKYACPCLE